MILLRSLCRDCFWNQQRHPRRTTASRTLRAALAFISVHQRSAWFFICEYKRPSAVEKTALLAVGPLFPPALSPPAKALGEKGGQAGLGRLARWILSILAKFRLTRSQRRGSGIGPLVFSFGAQPESCRFAFQSCIGTSYH
jgi:hypothetical protein